MNIQRCKSICANLRDKLYAIETELMSSHQEGYYLLEKIEPLIWDANVLKSEFEMLKKEQDLQRKGEE